MAVTKYFGKNKPVMHPGLLFKPAILIIGKFLDVLRLIFLCCCLNFVAFDGVCQPTLIILNAKDC